MAWWRFVLCVCGSSALLRQDRQDRAESLPAALALASLMPKQASSAPAAAVTRPVAKPSAKVPLVPTSKKGTQNALKTLVPALTEPRVGPAPRVIDVDELTGVEERERFRDVVFTRKAVWARKLDDYYLLEAGRGFLSVVTLGLSNITRLTMGNTHHWWFVAQGWDRSAGWVELDQAPSRPPDVYFVAQFGVGQIGDAPGGQGWTSDEPLQRSQSAPELGAKDEVRDRPTRSRSTAKQRGSAAEQRSVGGPNGSVSSGGQGDQARPPSRGQKSSRGPQPDGAASEASTDATEDRFQRAVFGDDDDDEEDIYGSSDSDSDFSEFDPDFILEILDEQAAREEAEEKREDPVLYRARRMPRKPTKKKQEGPVSVSMDDQAIVSYLVFTLEDALDLGQYSEFGKKHRLPWVRYPESKKGVKPTEADRAWGHMQQPRTLSDVEDLVWYATKKELDHKGQPLACKYRMLSNNCQHFAGDLYEIM